MKDEKIKKTNPIPPNSTATKQQSSASPGSTATNQQSAAPTGSTDTNQRGAAPADSTDTNQQGAAPTDSTATNQQNRTGYDSTTNQQKEKNTEMKNEEQTTTQEQSDSTPTQMTSKERISEANHIVKNRMIASVGAGLIPFPIVDIVALTGIQMDTVRALAKLYNVKFSKDIGKTAIGTLTGAAVPVATGPWISSLAKSIPVVGQVMGSISMPVIAGASTYAVGRVFIQHFESGGTFLTFDPEKVKDYFKEEFEKGKEFAKAEAKVS